MHGADFHTMTMICHSHGSVVNQKGGKADRGGSPPPKKKGPTSVAASAGEGSAGWAI